MKLLTFYTPSHEIFVEQFKNSLPDDNLEVIYHTYEQECPTGEFAEEGWNTTTRRKFEFIAEVMMSLEEDEVFTFSDIDIQFFKPITKLAARATAEHDVVFQNDYYGHACTGFFFCKNNPNTRRLIAECIRDIHNHRDDQAVMNHILQGGLAPYVNYALLPPQFFTFGMFYNHWHGETEFPLPPGIVMHHANWVKGIDNKIKLLQTVRNIYNGS